MKKSIFFIFLLCLTNTLLYGQKTDTILQKEKSPKFHYSTGLELGGSSKKTMPFWMYANKSGLYPNENYSAWSLNIGKISTSQRKLDWDFGVMGVASVSKRAEIRMRDYFLGIRYQQIRLSIGSQANTIAYDGLSTTNGDFIASLNARPYPKVQLELGYTNVPFTKGWVQFKGLYSEGIMLDDRFVEHPRLHYKNLYLKLGKKKFSFEVGLKHYAQWSGTSPSRGKLPTGLEVYKDLIFAKDNSKYDPLGSPVDYNRVGNHIGMYDVKLSYKGEKIIASLYRQVIFEDSSGRNFMNRDALMGLHIKRTDKKSWLQAILFEYYYTKYQSGTLTGPKPGGGIYTGNDNYFNQGVYTSGWTSYGYTIGTPLFTPSIDKNGVSKGIINNRIVAFHGGVWGHLDSQLSYKGLLTYSHNYGTYQKGFDQQQLSAYLEFIYGLKKIPAYITLGIASDFKGSYLPKNHGIFIKITTNGWWGK